MSALTQNLRFGLRQLRRAPAFTVTAVLTLALGIGANTAIFSLLDQALLRSLPVHHPQELVVLRGTGKVWEGHISSHGAATADASFSYPMHRDLRDRDTALQGLLATSPADVDFVYGDSSRIVRAEVVSGNYFTLLGVAPARGRLLTQGDDTRPGAGAVAVLSYDFWLNGLAGNTSVVGSTVSVNGHPFQVVGVASPQFRSAVWGETPSLLVPLSMTGQLIPDADRRLTDHRDRWLNLIGRLKPGTTRAQAEAQSAPLWHALRAEELKALGTRSPHFVDEFLTHSRLLLKPAARGFSYNRDTYSKSLFAVMGMALLVLLIAVTNVASLLLVRAAGRVHEFSMRYALGATGKHLLQQLLSEGFIIGLFGGLLGIAFAPPAIRVIVSRLADDDGLAPFTTTLDKRLLVFNFGVALLVSIAFSLAPALQMRRRDLMRANHSTALTLAGGMATLRKFIVGLQVGLSLLLLVGAGLFVRTVEHLRAENIGFRTDHLIVFGVSPRLAGYTPERIPAIRDQLLAALSTLPGVSSASITNDPELSGNESGGNITLASYTPAPEEEVDPEKGNVTPDFFPTLSIPLVAGRLFTPTDNLTHPLVAIVNTSFARRYFGSPQHSLGQRLADGASNHPVFDTEIVGDVADHRYTDLRSPAIPTLFRPMAQASGSQVNRELFVYLRTAADPTILLGAIRQRLASVDPLLAPDSLRTMNTQIENLLVNERLIALLSVSFGALAALLAGVGLYGVLAFATAQRTREIGARMALGASRLSVSCLVLADVVKIALCGITVGTPVAILLSRFARNQLYGVSPADPVFIGIAVALLGVVAACAAAIPARRAASVNPTEALRTE